MRMPTSGPASSNSSRTASALGTSSGVDTDRVLGDVPAVARAGEGDAPDRLVSSLARLGEARPDRGDGEDAAARAHDVSVAQSRPRVEDERAGHLGLLDPGDGHARLRGLGIA